MSWGFLPAALLMFAAAIGYAFFVRHEGRTGNAYFLFWPVKHWSRDRQPEMFRIRQFISWLMVVFLGLGALLFLIQFLGFAHA